MGAKQVLPQALVADKSKFQDYSSPSPHGVLDGVEGDQLEPFHTAKHAYAHGFLFHHLDPLRPLQHRLV